MFHFSQDENGLTVRVSGKAAEAVSEIAEILELNVDWPIIPLAIQNLHKICIAHQKTDEKLREVMIGDREEENAMVLFDIEELKVDAKKLEIKGLGQ